MNDKASINLTGKDAAKLLEGLTRLLICHPILLNSPFVEPAGIDLLLDDLLLERHPYTVAKANDNS